VEILFSKNETKKQRANNNRGFVFRVSPAVITHSVLSV